MLAQIIGSFVAIMVAFTLFPMIQEQVQIIQTQNNSTMGPAEKQMLDSIPFFFGLGIVGIAIATAIRALRGYDETSDGDDDEEIEEEEDKPKPKPHKQTYYEYVKERLAIEKLIHRG